MIILKDAARIFKMNEFTFDEIDRARKLLGLGEDATLGDIKEAYRRKAKKFHPDGKEPGRKKDCEKRMVQINRAYGVILNYIEQYEISFRKEDVDRNSPVKDMRRFFEDWLGR